MNERYLTKKQTEVAFYLCQGYDDKEISEAMGNRLGTTKSYIQNMFRKYGVNKRTKFMAEYLKEKELNNDLPPAA